MRQYGLPIANYEPPSFPMAWTQGAGDGDGDWFDELDDGFGVGRGTGDGPDDGASYWQAPPESSVDPLAVLLGPLTDPKTSVRHIIRCRARKSGAGGQDVWMTLELRQAGDAPVTTQVFQSMTETWTTYEYTLTAAEANSITDYSQLQMRVQPISFVGGAGRVLQVSALEFECPKSWAHARTRIKAILDTVSITQPLALSIARTYEYPPAVVQDLPCFVIVAAALDVRRAPGYRLKTYTTKIHLLVADEDPDQAAAIIDSFREAVVDAFDAAVTLDDNASIIEGPVVGEGRNFSYGGRDYAGLEFSLVIQLRQERTFAV